MTDREEFEAWFSQKGRFPKDVERSGEGYKEENATRSWAAWQAARATAEQSEPVAWMYKCWDTIHLHTSQLDHFYSIDNGDSYVKGVPLYAAA